jgi:hypothetical protein
MEHIEINWGGNSIYPASVVVLPELPSTKDPWLTRLIVMGDPQWVFREVSKQVFVIKVSTGIYDGFHFIMLLNPIDPFSNPFYQLGR